MKKRKRLALMALVLGVALMVALMGTMAVFAEDNVPVSTTGSVTIGTGQLVVTPTTVPLTGFTLDGTDHVITETDTGDWHVADNTGSGTGWHATLVSSNFITGSYDIAASGFDFQAGSLSIATGATGSQATSTITNTNESDWATDLSGVHTIMAAAADKGMGHYTFNPDWVLDVPADTYADSYEATITITIISSPS